jgi:hypothetical protein
MRIVVRLLRFAGRAWEPAADAPPAPALPQRAVEAKALKAAPGPAELPITLKQLAKKAGYGNNGHFQEAVRGLIDRGLLLRVRGGIRRARET